MLVADARSDRSLSAPTVARTRPLQLKPLPPIRLVTGLRPETIKSQLGINKKHTLVRCKRCCLSLGRLRPPPRPFNTEIVFYVSQTL